MRRATRAAAPCALLLLCPSAAPATAQEPSSEQEPGGDEHAFVELEAARTTCYVREEVRLVLRVGYDAEFFGARVVQPFRRRLDVPLQVHSSWFEALPAANREVGEAGRGPTRLALGDESADARRVADQERAGRTFAVLELERVYVPERAGALEIPGPEVHFVYATRFERNAFDERVPAETRTVRIEGAPLSMTVLALPEEGRPLEFTGAVGRFRVRATAEPRELEVGRPLTLELAIEGDGDLGALEPPRLDDLDGFHVLSEIDDGDGERRSMRYELVPRSEGVRSVPSIAFVYFDPGPPPGYRTARTDPIPITVTAPRAPPPLEPVAGSADRAPLPPAERPGRALLGRRLVQVAIVLVALVAIASLARAWRGARARARIAREPARVQARGAAAVFREHAGEPDADVGRLLADYLAARLGRSVPAVIAPDLARQLVAAGVHPELAERGAAHLEQLVASRFGGGPPEDAGATTRALVDALERDFTAAEHGR